jgi:hypothetical protein
VACNGLTSGGEDFLVVHVIAKSYGCGLPVHMPLFFLHLWITPGLSGVGKKIAPSAMVEALPVESIQNCPCQLYRPLFGNL